MGIYWYGRELFLFELAIDVVLGAGLCLGQNLIDTEYLHYTCFCINYFFEFAWTLSPSIFIIILVYFSLYVLYGLEEAHSSTCNFCLIGFQWYWSFFGFFFNQVFSEHRFFSNDFSYQSAFSITTPLSHAIGSLRVLFDTYFFYIYACVWNCIFVSSSDVIHAFSLSGMGIKTDAVPGRLHIVMLYAQCIGGVYGQCSELCGAYHGFMPFFLFFL